MLEGNGGRGPNAGPGTKWQTFRSRWSGTVAFVEREVRQRRPDALTAPLRSLDPTSELIVWLFLPAMFLSSSVFKVTDTSLNWSYILVGALLLVAAVQVRPRNLRVPLVVWAWTAVGVGRLIWSTVVEGDDLRDFAQANTWIALLVLSGLLAGSRALRTGFARLSIVVLTALFMASYVTQVLASLGTARPRVLVENNFELSLLLGLVVATFPIMKRERYPVIVAVALTTALSQSRSATISAALVVLFGISHLAIRRRRVWVGIGAGLVAFATVATVMFVSRASDGSTSARLKFLDAFMDETSKWTAANWLFGTPPITKLSDTTCQDLSYFETLFSFAGDGSCYSVILHAFVLRAIFDVGFIGLLAIFGTYVHLLRRAGVPSRVNLTLILMALANSVSVSGLNSPYVVWPFIVAMLLAPSRDAHASSIGEPSKQNDRGKLGPQSARVPGA